MTAVSRRSLVLLLLAAAAGAGVLFALLRTTAPATRAPLAVPALEPLVDVRVESGELPVVEVPALRAELTTPALSPDERARAIWRELPRLARSRVGKVRPGAAARAEQGAALVAELGALARGGSKVATELLARLVADPGRGWVGSAALAEALAGIEESLVARAIRLGFELAARQPQKLAGAVGAYLELAATHAGVDGARLLLDVHDGADEMYAQAALEALAHSADRSLRSAWLERLQQAEPARSEQLLRALIAWRDPGTEHALRALVHAPHLDAQRRAAIARGLAAGAQPEVALALAGAFWTTRGDPENALFLEAARACLENPALSREDLARVVEPIALELLRDPSADARRAALGMLAAPRLAARRTLDTLAHLRPELVEAGLRKESRAAIRAQMNNLRVVRNKAHWPGAPPPSSSEAAPTVR